MAYTAYTTNLCPNGSFETGLAGWTSISGATLVHTSQGAVAGQYSMLVETLGQVAGEGVIGPQSPPLGVNPITGSVSLSLWGESGTLIVTAAANPDGVLLAQQTVVLDGAWQRIVFNGLALMATQEVYVIIQTTGSPQALAFLVDGVQYEPESPAHPYIDGSFPGCTWEGAAFASASYQQGQYSISLIGGFHVEGSLKVTLAREVFRVSPPAGPVNFGGTISTVVLSPVAAFDDFALFESTDPDPAMTYAGWNTASLNSGKTGYSRPWGVFYPPLDYVASDGTYMWKRAQFMAMGLEFINVANGAGQNMASAQVEMMPLAGSTGLDIEPGPTLYDTPRSVRMIVKPARLNYAANPAFAVSLAGWTAAGSATLTRDGTVNFGAVGAYDGVTYAPGYSMKIVMATALDGATLAVPDLIAGDTYTASVYVLPAAGLADVQMQVGSTTGGVPGAAAAGSLLALGTSWQRSQVTFAAPASTISLNVTGVVTAGATFPLTFWACLCLIEAGEVAGTYFDGSLGDPDYMWEGTPGLSRSYWYPGYPAGQNVLADILGRHTPMSISAAEAQYLVPPTQ